MADAIAELKHADAVLEKYEATHAIPVATAPGTEEELGEILNMTKDQIDKATAEQCAEYSTQLAQYAFFVQRLMNIERSRNSWAKTILSNIVAKHDHEYDRFVKYETKVSLISAQNSYASQLSTIILHTQQRMDRLDSLASYIKYLSETFNNLGRVRMRNGQL